MYALTVNPPQQPQRERVHFDEIFSLSNTRHYSGQLKCCFAVMESLQRLPDQYSRAGQFHDTFVLSNSNICSFIGGQHKFTVLTGTASICRHISVNLPFLRRETYFCREQDCLTNSFGVMTNSLIFNCPALA